MSNQWFCKTLHHTQGQTAIALKGAYWPNGSTLKVFFIDGSPYEVQYVESVMREFERICNIKFLTVTDRSISDLRIAFNSGDGAWSYIGSEALDIPKDEPTINLGWLEATRHELGHSLGLLHEHQSALSLINWNKPQVIKDLSGPPNNWPLSVIQSNVFDRVDPTKVDSTLTWDKISVMEYAIPASWDLNGVGAPGSEDFSQMDKDFLLKIYPFSDAPVIPVPTQDCLEPTKLFNSYRELMLFSRAFLFKLALQLGLQLTGKETKTKLLSLLKIRLKL